MGIRSYKDFIEYMEKNKEAASIAKVIGKKATGELASISSDAESWLDVTDIMKEKYNLTGFQLGMLLGYFMAYQVAMQQFGIVVGGAQ